VFPLKVYKENSVSLKTFSHMDYVGTCFARISKVGLWCWSV